MAIVWIKEIRNYHPTGTLSLCCDDGGRHPRANGKEYGREEWLELAPPSGGAAYSSTSVDNLAVPWSFNFTQKLRVKTQIEGATAMATVEVRGEGGWDYLLIRDDEFRELGQVDVGSLGDAPGLNHSWWILALHSDGNVEFHCLERQGLLRNEALALGTFFINYSFDLANTAAKAVSVVAGAKKDQNDKKEKAKQP